MKLPAYWKFDIKSLTATFLILFQEVEHIVGKSSKNHISAEHYDLEVKDLNNFCPLVPGFDEFDIENDARAKGKACYKYKWIPDPCTMERSGREESDLLHCGHYSMTPCTGQGDDDNGKYGTGQGFDLQWPEVTNLCDNVVKNKGRTAKRLKHIKPMYWKWTFCEEETGTELRPCGHYSMAFYDDPILTGQPGFLK